MSPAGSPITLVRRSHGGTLRDIGSVSDHHKGIEGECHATRNNVPPADAAAPRTRALQCARPHPGEHAPAAREPRGPVLERREAGDPADAAHLLWNSERRHTGADRNRNGRDGGRARECPPSRQPRGHRSPRGLWGADGEHREALRRHPLPRGRPLGRTHCLGAMGGASQGGPARHGDRRGARRDVHGSTATPRGPAGTGTPEPRKHSAPRRASPP